MPIDPAAEKSRLRRAEYLARINRAMDYIEQHIAETLSLETVAKVACFSPFHFHRIFAAMTGETLNRFVRRIRVERAAGQLLANPGKSMTEIAYDCGFSGSAAFARSFKEFFGVTAGEWQRMSAADRNRCKQDRKIGKAFRNMGKAESVTVRHDGLMTQLSPRWRIEMTKNDNRSIVAEVSVKELPPATVIYVRHIGPYAGSSELFGKLFGKLYAFAGPRGLIVPSAELRCVYHDDPSVSDEEKLRVDACLVVPEGTPVIGEVGTMVIPGGTFGAAHFELGTDEFSHAWDAVVGGWLPESGYQMDDRLSFERYETSSEERTDGKCAVDICIPIRPL